MWSAVCPSGDLLAGDVRLIEVGDAAIIVFRTGSGALHAIEARCPHLGNYIPNGLAPGQPLSCLLRGEGIECPFHGWRFDGNGRCTGLPAAQRRPPGVTAGKRLMRTWRIREVRGRIELGRSVPPDPP